MFQVFYLLDCRSLRDAMLKIVVFTNKTVFVGIAAIFASAPLAPGDVLASILVGAVIPPVIALEKWWRGRAART